MMTKKVLVLGVTGMLGQTVFRYLSKMNGLKVFGTIRSPSDRCFFSADLNASIIEHVDVLDNDVLIDVFTKTRPDLVINCVGVIKQLAISKDPLTVLPINAMLPHRLVKLCHVAQSRLIHISTDCVFTGKKGSYIESDMSDAEDLYGKSKYIGEIHHEQNAVTLRTSIIGHELNSHYALVDWFFSQQGSVKGYQNAVFSGMPTVEIARVIAEYVIPNQELCGLYHVSADPIDKYTLLKLIAEVYGKNIDIIPDTALHIDRSLNSSLFRKITGYVAPKWPELILKMKDFSQETINHV